MDFTNELQPLQKELQRIVAQQLLDGRALSTNICWFCSRPDATLDSAQTIYLNHNLRMEIYLGGTKTRWEETRRKVPACTACNAAHSFTEKAARKWALLYLAAALAVMLLPPVLLLFIFGIPTSKRSADGAQFLGMVWAAASFIVIACAGTFGYRRGKALGLAASPFTRPREYALEHPSILPLIQEGWREGKVKR
jgi:hypothetical protein